MASSWPLGAQSVLSVGAGAGKPGYATTVAVSLTSSPVATALQVDLVFDAAVLTAGAPLAGSALADHVLASSVPQPGTLRLVVYSPTNALLSAGEVAEVPFTVAAAAAPALEPLDPWSVEAGDIAAVSILPQTLNAGSVHVFTLEADLSVEKTADRTLVASGDPLTYTVVVENPGSDPVTGAQVTDPVPADVISVGWTCTPSGGASCTAAAAGDVVDTVDLPLGAGVTYTITGTVSSAAPFFDNTSAVSAPVAVLDANATNDTDTATVQTCGLDDRVLTGFAITDLQVFVACLTLTAGPDFRVLAGGDVTLHSLGMVILGNGFSLEDGGKLMVEASRP